MKAAANSVLLSQKEIQARVAEIGREISRDYAGRPLTAIPIEIDFIATSSYGSSTSSSGEVRIVRDVGVPVEGKDLLVVEDIVDSGRTLTHVIALLSSRGASSVRIATLLEKPDSSKYCGDLHYVGFRIPSRFVVGYGLDYAEHYRNLAEIRILDET
jgi:hypoxanthine phosphoribosyltransferase